MPRRGCAAIRGLPELHHGETHTLLHPRRRRRGFTEEQKSEKKALAEETLNRINGAADKASEFDACVTELSEDSSKANYPTAMS